jgi:MFS family permease
MTTPALATPRRIQTVYLALLLGNTLASSFIWGINTIFLLDAGLTNAQAFAANAFFTAGQVIFEVPTGVVADTRGRRASYLLGAFTLAVSTTLYYVMWRVAAPFWGWAIVSMLLGLGFTFFSGAVEAWLVDALHATGFTGELDAVFGRGSVVSGIAMLAGSVAGGFIAQVTNLGVPYLIRAAILLATFVLAFFLMKDIGFTPRRSQQPLQEIKEVFVSSLNHGLRNPRVKWIMLAAPFSMGVGFYIFYALQPYFLELYGDESAYGIAGLVAAIVAGAQIVGGMTVPYLRRLFTRRTSALVFDALASVLLFACIALTQSLLLVILIVMLWGYLSAAVRPMRQAYLNDHIPSAQRATVLSFDSLMGSSGGIVIQPALGRAADLWGYATSFMSAAVIEVLALPFLLRARERSD